MRIALVGGIYGKNEAFRRNLQVTPETLLEHDLIGRGHQVATFSHYAGFSTRQFDVIHVHHLSYGAIRAAADDTEVPFIYTSHDGAAMTHSVSALRQVAARLVMARADAVVALSKAEADFQQAAYALAGAVHTVIPTGLGCSNYAYAPKSAGGRGRSWQVLYVGQLIGSKNVDLLLRAIAQVPWPVELQLVYHNSFLEGSLRRLACELGLSKRVHFLGGKSARELPAFYQRADVFVLPSSAEALPSVITEAMLCGTPVIASDVGGIREQLGGYGVCVPPGRPDELAAAISYVIDHYDWFAERSKEASAYSRDRFSVENMVERHLELYTDLLERKGPRRRHGASRVAMNALLKMGASLACAMK